MPFPMKIQPVDSNKEQEARTDFNKPVPRSRFRKLFDRQFRISSSDRLNTAGDSQYAVKDGGGAATDLEPSSLCLDKMVQNFIEDNNDRPPPPPNCRRSRCNCFHANSGSSDDEFDVLGTFTDFSPAISFADSGDLLKSLVSCTSGSERNLLADTARIVEKNKHVKRKDELRRIVMEGLSSLGHEACIFTSRWERSSSSPAGVYEFIDAIAGGEKLVVDVDFRSEFEIARPTANYKAILQSLPSIFVGKPERLRQIVAIVAEGVKQSLKKKGMPLPPWRNAEYMSAKWLSCYRVEGPPPPQEKRHGGGEEMELIFGEETPPHTAEEKQMKASIAVWQPPEIRERSCPNKGTNIVTGLASLLKEKPYK